MTIFAESHHLKENATEQDDNSARLINRLLQLNATIEPKIDIEKVKQAIYYIKKYHAHQQRHSGEPYYYHPLEVALLTTDYFQDTETIIAALLHDIVEDSEVSLKQIKFIFGEKVAKLVDIVTKVTLDYQLSKEETLHKLSGLSNHDCKAITVKILDRLHNMRTLEHIKSKEKQKRIAVETLQFYVPLAKYLNMTKVEYELNILTLKALNL